MTTSSAEAYPYLEETLPGFHRGRELIKGAGDSLAVLSFDRHQIRFLPLRQPVAPRDVFRRPAPEGLQ